METVAGQVAFAMERIHSTQALALARTEAVTEKNRLEALMQALPVGVAVIDGRGGNIGANAAFEQVWGSPRPATRTVDDYAAYRAWWPETGQPVRPEEWASAQVIRTGESVVGQLMQIERFDGTRAFVLNSATPIFDADGRIAGSAVAIQDVSELHRTQQALRESEERLRMAVEAAELGTWDYDPVTGALNWSGRCKAIFGLASDAKVDYPTFLNCLQPEDRERVHQCVQQALDPAGTGEFDTEYRALQPDGTRRWITAAGKTFFGNVNRQRVAMRFIGTVMDDTARKRREEKLHKLNRTLKAHSRSNQAMVRVSNEAEFLNEICKIVVEDCGHKMVWIGFAEEDAARSVRPVAFAGFDEGYLEALNVSWADTERGRGPTGTAIRTGRPSACSNMLTDPKFTPWRQEAIKRGYASSIAFPLMANGKAFGALTIYAMEADPFSEDEVEFLGFLAADLAHGITTLRLRNAHAQAEEALRQSERRYRSLVELSPDAVYVNRANRIDFVNPAALQLFGAADREQILGKSPFDLFHPDCHDKVRERIRALNSGQAVPLLEERILRLDSAIRDVEVAASPFVDSEGPAIQVILHDITERKRTDEALKEFNRTLELRIQERTAELENAINQLQTEVTRRTLAEQVLRERSQLLEAFFKHTITPLAFLDRQFNFVRVNDAYARADQRSAEDFIGRNYFELFPNEENKGIFADVIRSKEPYTAFAKPFLYPDHPEWGVSYWDWELTPILDGGGEAQFLVLSQENVTDRAENQERLKVLYSNLQHRAGQLRALAQQLTQAEEQERRQLATVLHDDLQQSLAAAKMQLGRIAKRIDGGQELDEMIGLVKSLLKNSIETTRNLSHELSPPILQQLGLMDSLEWICRQAKAKHGLNVQLTGSIDIEPAMAVKTFLFRSVQEMLFNVVKHAGVDMAKVEICQLDGMIRLTVSDEGQGFNTGQTGIAGRISEGFGLFSIQERISLLGGQLTVESAPGKGCRLMLYAPAERAAGDKPQVDLSGADGIPRFASEAAVPDAERPRRVMLVDDHSVLREGLASLLVDEPQILIVGEAGDGRQAIRMVPVCRPDVILMDVSMPNLNGIEATRAIKERWPWVRVIGLSMFQAEDMAKDMLDAGAEAYFNKGAPPTDLIEAVRRGPPGQ